VNMIAKLIPDELKMTLAKAVETEKRLAKLIDEDDEVARLFDLAYKLEGKHRNAGTHAAGVVIGKDALVENAPLFKITGAESKVVQWDMGNSEKMGLIKFDFLGLKTLTVIDWLAAWCANKKVMKTSILPPSRCMMMPAFN